MIITTISYILMAPTQTRKQKQYGTSAQSSIIKSLLSSLIIFFVTQAFDKFWMKTPLHASFCGFLCSLLFVVLLTV